MQSRAAIEQAKGILMATNGLDEDQAFELLVRASERENKKLRDIAQRMVEGAPRARPRRQPAARRRDLSVSADARRERRRDPERAR